MTTIIMTDMMTHIYSHQIDSPLGKLKLYASDKALIGLFMENEKPGGHRLPLEKALPQKTKILALAEKELDLYFSGKLKIFTVCTELCGTEFQISVWNELKKIPNGKHRSYSQHAEKICRPTAVRAVSTAIGKNPISIIVPCHRVLGKNGDLVGYAGGLAAKKWLLQHEGHSL